MNYVGVDVSKAKLDCLWLKDAETGKVKTKVVANNTKGIQSLPQWLLETLEAQPHEIQVIMEATGIYHEAVAYALHEQGFQVSVVNPARAKEFAKGLGNTHKTDKKDSFLLAFYGLKMQPALWAPEPREIRELKALLARLEAISGDLQRELNRLEKAEISGSSSLVIQSLQKMIGELKAEKSRLENEIDDHIDRHPQLQKNRALLESIPGIGPALSRVMLAVIHSRSFTKASHLAAFLGLIPVLQESGTFKGRSRLSKIGPSGVRAKLYMAAVVAKQHNPDVRAHYNRLRQRGKSTMQALAAAMRKLVHICFGVIKQQSEYQPQVTLQVT